MTSHALKVHAILTYARDAGLLGKNKNARITGRVSSVLLHAAKARSGLTSDTEVIELALAILALEDNFGVNLVGMKGSVTADVDIGF